MKKAKLWSGRFTEATSKIVEKFTSSIVIDSRLYKEDILGSIAWANALKKAKVITSAEALKIGKCLKDILAGIQKGKIKLKEELEDVHMNIESLLIAKIGETGKKLHTGRSRNDQVATDLRLHLKEQIADVVNLIVLLQKTLISMAEQNIAVIMPGYTHMQQAQPVLFSHHIMAYFEMLERDKARLFGAFERTDVMPLGSAALSGTSYPIDRNALAKELDFNSISANSMDAVSDRDFVAETIFCLSMAMMHLSRFCEELIIWTSKEFNFIEISDAYTTGSSIMPQKKNPDVAELIRGKSGSVYGNLTAILVILKGLPLTYNRDLQEDKKMLFEALDTVKASLSVFTEMLKNIKVNSQAMAKSMEGSIAATDLADYLVEKGLAFRDAHEIVGKVVAYCKKAKKDLSQISLWELRGFSKKVEADVFNSIIPEKGIECRNVAGGTAKKQVLHRIAEAKKKI